MFYIEGHNYDRSIVSIPMTYNMCICVYIVCVYTWYICRVIYVYSLAVSIVYKGVVVVVGLSLGCRWAVRFDSYYCCVY